MIFGLLNPEKLWHENLTHLFTSPVRCSHFALESQKVSFNSIVYTYFWLLNIFFRLVKRLYRHYINHNQILFTLTFRSLSEIVVRRSFSILLPVLATVVMWRGKKSVVRVAQNLQSWIRNLREVPDGLRKQCTSERREGVLWTGTRTVIHWATRTSFCSKKRKRWTFWSTVYRYSISVVKMMHIDGADIRLDSHEHCHSCNACYRTPSACLVRISFVKYSVCKR